MQQNFRNFSSFSGLLAVNLPPFAAGHLVQYRTLDKKALQYVFPDNLFIARPTCFYQLHQLNVATEKVCKAFNLFLVINLQYFTIYFGISFPGICATSSGICYQCLCSKLLFSYYLAIAAFIQFSVFSHSY